MDKSNDNLPASSLPFLMPVFKFIFRLHAGTYRYHDISTHNAFNIIFFQVHPLI